MEQAKVEQSSENLGTIEPMHRPERLKLTMVHFNTTARKDGNHNFYAIFVDEDNTEYEYQGVFLEVQLKSYLEMIAGGREFLGMKSPRLTLQHFWKERIEEVSPDLKLAKGDTA